MKKTSYAFIFRIIMASQLGFFLQITIYIIFMIVIAATMYWLVGYALAFGEGNALFGWTYWALYGLDPSRLAFWFFQYSLTSAVMLIPSGSICERFRFPAYCLLSCIVSGITSTSSPLFYILRLLWLLWRGSLNA